MRMSSLALCAALVSFAANGEYVLTNGVLEVNVPSGGTQTGFTQDQKDALADAECVEMRKTGEGILKLTKSGSNAGISKFKGKITIAEGIYYIYNDSGEQGFLGTGDGETVVESGATIRMHAYVSSAYKDEEITLSGTGCNGEGALSRIDPQDGPLSLSFKKMTLAADTLICSNHGRGFTLTPAILDMGGHELRMEGINGKNPAMDVNPDNVVNDGSIYLKTTGYGFPRKADLTGGPSHVITLDIGSATSYSNIHTNHCNWTLYIKNPGSGIRSYKPPFVWDGPLRLPDTGKVYLYANSNGADRDLWYIRFNGPLYGGCQIVNSGDAFAPLVFACPSNNVTFNGTFTWSGNTIRSPIVGMVPGAIPDVTDKTKLVPLSGAYITPIGFGPRTATNPNGYTATQITNEMEKMFQNRAVTMLLYVEKGQTFTLDKDFDSAYNYHWRQKDSGSNGNLRFGAIGGETVFRGKYDSPQLFQNFLGESLVLTSSGRDDGKVNKVAQFTLAGGRTTLRDMGLVIFDSITAGGLSCGERAELFVTAGTVMGKGKYGIVIGSRDSGAGGRFKVGSGATVSNTFIIAGSRAYKPCHGELCIDGGAVIGTGEFDVGVTTNACGSIEVRGGSLAIPSYGMFLSRYNPGSCGIFNQTGGSTEIATGNTSRYIGLGVGTSLLRVGGGTFRNAGFTRAPMSFAEANGGLYGTANIVVDGGGASFDGGIYLADRGESFASVTISGGVLEAPFVRRVKKSWGIGHVISNAFGVATFDGGTLRASADGQLFGSSSDETALDAVYVRSGGATIDTAGHDVTASIPLSAVPTAGGIQSLGLSSSYSCWTMPAVQIVGDGTGAVAVANYDFDNHVVTNVTVLNPGWGYTAANTTAKLFYYQDKTKDLTVTIGANGASGGLVKKGDGVLTLTAANTYAGATVVEGGGLRIAGEASVPSELSLNGGWLETEDVGDFPNALVVNLGVLDKSKRRYVLAKFSGERPATIPEVTGWSAPAGEPWIVRYRGNELVIEYCIGAMVIIR